MKVVIVGGVAGGMSAATRLRRLDEEAEIVVLERGAHVSFANCGLPYYVGGIITDRSALLLQTPESLSARFDLDVRVCHEVISIDRDRKRVRVRRLDTGKQYAESYDHLILSTGAAAFLPEIDGIERALTLRDVADVDALAGAAEQARTAVVLGAGFIGLELAENLVAKDVTVTLVELADQVLAPLDPEMAYLVQQVLEAHGIDVRLGVQATRLTRNSAELSDGDTVAADLVIAAIGVRPESRLAVDAGLEVARWCPWPAPQIVRADLELAYAPQFGSAKDPVNMLGFIVENHRAELADSVQWDELSGVMAEGTQLIDVRTPDEWARGTIPGAVRVPVDELRGRLDEVADEVVVHCQVGLRGHVAQRLLAHHGRRVRNLDGGYQTWLAGTSATAGKE